MMATSVCIRCQNKPKNSRAIWALVSKFESPNFFSPFSARFGFSKCIHNIRYCNEQIKAIWPFDLNNILQDLTKSRGQLARGSTLFRQLVYIKVHGLYDTMLAYDEKSVCVIILTPSLLVFCENIKLKCHVYHKFRNRMHRSTAITNIRVLDQ